MMYETPSKICFILFDLHQTVSDSGHFDLAKLVWKMVSSQCGDF